VNFEIGSGVVDRQIRQRSKRNLISGHVLGVAKQGHRRIGHQAGRIISEAAGKGHVASDFGQYLESHPQLRYSRVPNGRSAQRSSANVLGQSHGIIKYNVLVLRKGRPQDQRLHIYQVSAWRVVRRPSQVGIKGNYPSPLVRFRRSQIMYEHVHVEDLPQIDRGQRATASVPCGKGDIDQ